MPEYNSSKDIQQVHITVRRQSSNASVVNNTSGILVRGELLQDDVDKELSSSRYYVIINNSDIKNNKFQKDVLYKVQLRFSSVASTAYGDNINNFFTENISAFS